MPEKIENTALMSSAGAGKTRALTKRFLYLYLHEADFQLKSLYGITFTNEAAFEMKTRVLNYLDLLIAKTSDDPADAEIVEYFQRCYPDIEQRAKVRKKHLLNNLTEFNIYTFHSLFASFLSSIPFAAGILPGYRIIDEAGEAIFYERILDKYFEIGRREKEQFEYLRNFVQQNDVRMKRSIKNIHRSIMPWLAFLADLIGQEKKLITEVKKNESEFFKTLKQIEEFIHTHEEATYVKNSSHMNKNMLRFCEKIDVFLGSKEFDILEQSEYTKTILRGDLINKKYIKKFIDNLGPAKNEFEKLLNDLASCVTCYLQSLSDRQIAIYLRPILEIHSPYEKEKRAQNLISFDDIEELTLRALKAAPDMDYLYFKLGAVIGHLMIDEFQDTSYRQLSIITPLIDEILSVDPHEKSLFYVGDPKQAIYRWRGGVSELFNVLTERYPEKIVPKELTINYRSKTEVVDFVNKVLDKEDEAQKDNTGGWIRIENIGEYDDEQGQQEIINRTASLIKKLCDNYNYSYSDIAVLVRTNNYGMLLSEGFVKAGIPHSSTSKCNILNNADVRTIYKLLEFLDDPQNDFALLHVLFSPFFNVDEEIVRRLIHPGRTLFLCLRDAHPGWPVTKKLEKLLKMVHILNPYDLIFHIYQELRLKITYALATLLDIALDYTIEETGHLSSFLNWLRDVGDSVQVTEVQPEGVQILTVHKAKGLEFDIILLPETNWLLRLNEDPKLLFSYKANGVEPEGIYWRKYGRYLQGLKDAEQNRLVQDELNLLYVALTRARSGIHILGYRHKKRGLGFWAKKIAEKIGDFDYSKGEIIKKPKITLKPDVIKEYGPITWEPTIIKEERSLYSPTDRVLELVDITRRQGMEFGTIVHDAMSNLAWLDNVELQSYVEKIVRRVSDKHARTHEEAAVLKKELVSVLIDTLSDPDLRFLFFKEGRSIEYMNEVAIYFEEKEKDISGQIDRLMIEHDKIIIIDYKTGVMEEKYKHQLEIYKKGIEKIYPGRQIKALLVYLNNKQGTKLIEL